MAAHGLAADGAESISGPPDGSPARAIEVSYRYGHDQAEPDGLIHGGLAVPLEESGSRIGYLAVYSRDSSRRFDDDDVRGLEELTQRATPAIENARKFREARQLADLDALTGLHNRRYFHETLARECARAHRYNRRLALIVFDLDDFKVVNDKIGHLARRRGARRGGRARARGDPHRRHPVPRRRRRVRGDPARVRDPAGGAALRPAAGRRSRAARSARPGSCTSPPASPS